jgi:hypothetical protein
VRSRAAPEGTEIPYPGSGVQGRNAFARGTDQDTGQDAQGIRVPPVTADQIALLEALKRANLIRSLDDRAFDYSHPVDEYAPQGSPGAVQSLTVQPDYDMPERITTIMVIIPVGATGASLQLGQRTWQLYSGAALTTPAILPMPVHGVILNSDDPRILTLTGTITSQPYVGLTGFALTRGQFS